MTESIDFRKPVEALEDIAEAYNKHIRAGTDIYLPELKVTQGRYIIERNAGKDGEIRFWIELISNPLITPSTLVERLSKVVNPESGVYVKASENDKVESLFGGKGDLSTKIMLDNLPWPAKMTMTISNKNYSIQAWHTGGELNLFLNPDSLAAVISAIGRCNMTIHYERKGKDSYELRSKLPPFRRVKEALDFLTEGFGPVRPHMIAFKAPMKDLGLQIIEDPKHFNLVAGTADKLRLIYDTARYTTNVFPTPGSMGIAVNREELEKAHEFFKPANQCDTR